MEYYDAINFLKAGITGSEGVATVSPTYAEEITTPAFGCGLDGALRDRSSDLVGILNGVDYEEWNTTDNPHLSHHYNGRDLKGKILGKRALQVEVGLNKPTLMLRGSVPTTLESTLGSFAPCATLPAEVVRTKFKPTLELTF